MGNCKMKSIGIKTLLTLLVLLISNFSLCVNNNLRREFTDSFLSSDMSSSSNNLLGMSASANATTSANITTREEEDMEASSVKNTWDTGFILPKFEVKNQDEKEFYTHGKVNIFPKNMETAKNTKIVDPLIISENQIGFIIEFPPQDLTSIKHIPFLNYLGGERFSIPWRFFAEKPVYKNPFGFKNKFITASLIDDKGRTYTIKLSLPWKRFGWYISDVQAKKICTIAEEMSQKQNLMIKNYKTEINKIYSKIEAN